jgi:hypothetical protein
LVIGNILAPVLVELPAAVSPADAPYSNCILLAEASGDRLCCLLIIQLVLFELPAAAVLSSSDFEPACVKLVAAAAVAFSKFQVTKWKAVVMLGCLQDRAAAAAAAAGDRWLARVFGRSIAVREAPGSLTRWDSLPPNNTRKATACSSRSPNTKPHTSPHI